MCILPEDIQELFYKVTIGTKVRIVHIPYKIGTHFNKTFVEAHKPLSDPYYNENNNVDLLKIAPEAISKSHGYPIHIY